MTMKDFISYQQSILKEIINLDKQKQENKIFKITPMCHFADASDV